MSKSLVRSIKNVANGYSSGQILVRNATSNDPSGPTTYDMEEIASYTYQSQTDFLEIMDMIDRRLNDKGKNWRHVAKSLTVLDYLVRYGSEKCVLWAKDNLYIIKTLREFIHFDESNNDQGAIIRVKAKELVALLQNDERLRHERDLAASSRGRHSGGRRTRRNSRLHRPVERDDGEAYDEDLQRALELSKITAKEDLERQKKPDNEEDLQAALKLSMEEEEMRRLKQQQNENLLDLNDYPLAGQQPQYYMTTGYIPVQYYQVPQDQIQYDMFGNPIQNPMTTGLYQLQYAQYQQPTQQAQFTGFNPQHLSQQQQQQQQQQPLQPLKTGSNNPFALNDNDASNSTPPTSSNGLHANQFNSSNFLDRSSQPIFSTQPTSRDSDQYVKPQTTSSSKFNDFTHSELNNLLAQGTGVDTFGNTGATRIPHQHTKTQQFINSSGVGFKQGTNEPKLSSNATGNPFLNTGIGYQLQQINPVHTGYGFGNADNNSQPKRTNDGPSLIDI